MNEIIKRGSATWFIVEKNRKFLQNDGTFKDSLTNVRKYTDIFKAKKMAEGLGTVRTMETDDFRIY